jgi:hypothetical protein
MARIPSGRRGLPGVGPVHSAVGPAYSGDPAHRATADTDEGRRAKTRGTQRATGIGMEHSLESRNPAAVWNPFVADPSLHVAYPLTAAVLAGRAST